MATEKSTDIEIIEVICADAIRRRLGAAAGNFVLATDPHRGEILLMPRLLPGEEIKPGSATAIWRIRDGHLSHIFCDMRLFVIGEQLKAAA